MSDPSHIAERHRVRVPLFVYRAQFDRFTANGICTANMEITQMLPIIGEPAPAPDVAEHCQCARCRVGEMGHA